MAGWARWVVRAYALDRAALPALNKAQDGGEFLVLRLGPFFKSIRLAPIPVFPRTGMLPPTRKRLNRSRAV